MSYKKDLWSMINKVKARNYLIADSFSKVGNSDLGGIIDDELFFKEFNVISHKTYYRLATILDVVNDLNKNTIFITGFRGSGKTTFVNLVRQLVESRINLPSMDAMLKEECHDMGEDDQEVLTRKYDSTVNKINHTLSYYFPSTNQLNFDNIHTFLQTGFNGICIYINFEKETRDHKKPIEQVLNSRIKNDFRDLYSNNLLETFLSEFCGVVKNISSINDFESTEGLPFKGFIDFISDESTKNECNWDLFIESLDARLSALNSNQLLCIITLVQILKNKDNATTKQYYIFDNIDIIQEDERRVLEDFLTSYSVFIVLMTQLARDISSYGINIDFYRDMTFIFVMRETTTMLINDHFEDRLKSFSEHFDISSDVDKGHIIRKKRDFLEKQKENITNNRLLADVQLIYKASLDNYVRDFIYSLFNNDYKRMIGCISELCSSNKRIINEQIEMMENPCNSQIISSIKHGSRSMLLRIIFDHFKEKNYFTRIGVDQINSRTLKYTPSRIILTYLYGYQSDHNDRFMISDEQPILLHNMFDELKIHFGGNTNNALNIFVDTLWGMFSLRTSESWNHLITFDSIKSISKDAITAAIRNKENVHVRITCAGRYYLRRVCTHFEFFSCRRCRNSSPLFSKDNLAFNTKEKKYQFEILIEAVYKKVLECCKHLLISEEDIFINLKGYTRLTLINDACIYCNDFQNAATHSERIIHHHIQYIDAYRLFLINGHFSENVIDINKRIISLLEKYLELMKPCSECNEAQCSLCNFSAYNDGEIVSGHFSENNSKLYRELMACVKLIKDHGYQDTSTEISREYFKDNNLKLHCI